MQEPKKKSWHFDPATERTAALASCPDADYLLLNATQEDTQQTVIFYQQAPVAGYDIAKVEVIYNRDFNIAFESELKRLQNKKGSAAFAPTWSLMNHIDLRQQAQSSLEGMCQPYVDPDYPDVKLMPAWHGTKPGIIESIFKVGYSNLAITDSGFFGKGLYSAFEAEYSYRVYAKGALILNWVACFSALPVVDDDMQQLRLLGKANYKNYDAHFVPVIPKNPDNPNEIAYIPYKAGDKPKYHEIVVFQTTACLPRFLVTLQPTLTKSITPNTTISKSFTSFEMGLTCICQSDFKTALGHLMNSELDDGYLLAPLFLYDLYSKSGLVGPIDILRSQFYHAQIARNFNAIEKLALQNNVSAIYILGRCYEEGIGVKRNLYTAFKHYSDAAKQNNVFAQCQLGLFYEKGMGTLKDEKKAFDYYQLSAAQDYGVAQSLLGFCYANGIGVAKDSSKARICYESAVTQNYAPAQCTLAEMYEYGEGGLPKDVKQAIAYYKLSAKQGFLTAQYILGVFYEHGKGGVTADRIKAAKWYQMAANQGHPMAVEALRAQLSSIEQNLAPQIPQPEHYRPILTSSSPSRNTKPENPDKSEQCVLQ